MGFSKRCCFSSSVCALALGAKRFTLSSLCLPLLLPVIISILGLLIKRSQLQQRFLFQLLLG
jgi:hypothetical protein